MITNVKRCSLKGKFIAKKQARHIFSFKENPILKELREYVYKPYELNRSLIKDGYKIEIINLKKCRAYLLKKADSKSTKVTYVIHGGGYVFPISDNNIKGAYLYNKYLDSDVFLIDYRVNEMFPAGIEDCYEGYEYISKLYDNVFLAGQSAGAGLAVGLLLYLKKHEVKLPLGTFLASPFLDVECRGITYLKNRMVDVVFGSYYKEEKLPNRYVTEEFIKSEYVDLLNSDLSNIGPVLVQAGSDEMLLSDSLAFEEKNRSVNVIIYKNMWHDFYTHRADFREAKLAWKNIKKFGEEIYGKRNE